MQQLFFLSGLPRSGSQWLGRLLNQNPCIYVPLVSAFIEVLWRQYSIWDDPDWKPDFLGMEDLRSPYLKKASNVYFSYLTDKPVVIDNRRHWQAVENIEMYIEIFGEKPKIICPVRNIEEIMASFASLFHKNDIEWSTDRIAGNTFDLNYVQLKNTFESKYKDCLLLIDYKDLSTDPISILKKIYEFIGEDFYNHDLNATHPPEMCKKIEKFVGLNGLFNIKSGIKKSESNPNNHFTVDQVNNFAEMNFW